MGDAVPPAGEPYVVELCRAGCHRAWMGPMHDHDLDPPSYFQWVDLYRSGSRPSLLGRPGAYDFVRGEAHTQFGRRGRARPRSAPPRAYSHSRSPSSCSSPDRSCSPDRSPTLRSPNRSPKLNPGTLCPGVHGARCTLHRPHSAPRDWCHALHYRKDASQEARWRGNSGHLGSNRHRFGGDTWPPSEECLRRNHRPHHHAHRLHELRKPHGCARGHGHHYESDHDRGSYARSPDQPA